MFDETEEEYNEMQELIYGPDYASPPDPPMTEEDIEAYFGPDEPDSMTEDEYNAMQELVHGSDYAAFDPDADLDSYFD